MSKPKERSDLENLRGQIKSLKSENRNLKRQLSRFSKRAHLYEDLEVRQAEEDLEQAVSEHINTPPKDACPQCGKKLTITDLNVRLLIRCEYCGHRETKKI